MQNTVFDAGSNILCGNNCLIFRHFSGAEILFNYLSIEDFKSSTALSGSIPSIRTRFSDEVWPEMMETSLFGSEKKSETARSISLFAFPSTGGAEILHNTALRHSL